MKTLICGLLRGYQIFIAPFLRLMTGTWSTGMCRFTPSCSHYFMEAVRRHGAWRGSLLGMRRLTRCHPWGGFGEDPVPDLPDRKLDTRKSIIL